MGYLEVGKEGIWGTVCHSGWDMEASVSACRQLGYHTGQRLIHVHDTTSLVPPVYRPIHYQGKVFD